MQRRRYSKPQRAEAVGQALAKGSKATAEVLGIPRRTLDYWIHHPEFASLRHRARDEVADEMWGGVQLGVRAVIEGFQDPEAPLRDKATALGILYDRYALLTGSATSRTEARDITGSLTDSDVVAAILEAHALTVGSRAPSPAEDAPEG